MRKSFALLLFIMYTLGAVAQFGRLYMGDQYLMSSIASKVIQDHYGRIWIGTRNGICMYDGYRFRNFKKESHGDLGLNSNYINEVSQDRQGNIYLGSNEGVSVLRGDHFHAIRLMEGNKKEIKGYVQRIYQTSTGETLIAVSGHGVYKMVNDTTAQIWDKQLRVANFVTDIFEDRSKRIWLLTSNKGVWTRENGIWTKCQLPDDPQGPFVNICQDHDGTLYLANLGGGLYRSRKGNPLQLECVPGTKHLPLNTVTISQMGFLLLGTDGVGVFRYLPQSQQVEQVNLYCREVDINRAKIMSIMEDREGNLWLNLFQKGIFMQPRPQFGFQYIGAKSPTHNLIGEACVMATRYGKDGTLFVSTDKDGLYAIGPDGTLKRHYTPGKGAQAVPFTILGITEDTQGRLWIGTYLQGAGWLDKQTGEYHQLRLANPITTSVFDVVADKWQNLWIATMGEGLKRVNLATGKVTEYRDRGKGKGLCNDYINQLRLSSDGKRLYIGTCEGLSAFDISQNKWMPLGDKGKGLLTDLSIIDIVEDAKQHLWIATYNGICHYDPAKRATQWYTIKNNLSDNSVSALRIDRKGRLWASTTHGLNCLDPKTGEIRNYFANDGLQGNEFSEGVSCMKPNGEIVFGGIGGLTLFQPDKIKGRKKKLDIQLISLYASNRMVSAGMESGGYIITEKPVIESNTFHLGPMDNSFTMVLSTLSFANPERITFSYRMNDEDWERLEPGDNRLSLSHMPPGTYHFEVQASDGGTKSDIREFTIVIHPAWYQSAWAKTFYLLLALAAIIWIFIAQRRKAQDKLRLQEHIHSEELSEAKIRFFMNISHEIRTPMTLIISPLLSLMNSDKDAKRQAIYEVIKRNAERILHLINQMMDLRKIEKGKMQMRMQETNLIGFLNDLYSLFQLQAKAKGIKLNFHHDSEQLPVWIDLDNFDKVVVNILSNALKFTPSGGEITMSVTHDEQHVQLSIKDTGEAIPADKMDKIFERFFQSTESINNRKMGTGIGLDLTHSLVELHHGTITARNNEDGKGCEFIVTLPLGNAHLKPEEIITPEEQEARKTNSTAELVDEQPDTGNDQASPRVSTTGNPRIVIVEDDEEIRHYLATELGKIYRVTEYDNGADALMNILKQTPDLVISDVVMPKMDGVTLCTKLKTHVGTNHLPVILLTGRGEEENQLEGLETGADAYIVKPFSLDILKRTIANLLFARQVLRNKYSGQEEQADKVTHIDVKSPDEKLLEKVMEVINKNLDNAELNVDTIAEAVGISRGHLYRRMKQLTNQSPHDLIRNIRLKQAANLLSTGNHSITEVMYACGFSNAASFSTMFKNFYGMSPREYMREHSKE